MGYFKSLKFKIRRFRQLSRPERRLFMLAFGLLPGLALSLKWRGLARTQKMLTEFPFQFKNPTRQATLSKSMQKPKISPGKIAWIVQVVARQQPTWATCLNQSVLLWWLLQRHNIESELRFGVRREPETGQFEAHAWVEYQGQILNDAAELHQHFAPLEYLLKEIVL